ncbi:BglG family transcription antiterminator [Oceanobacillus sp. M65]|nr:BglG family transcription antiterminator [Oceanobacillus jordanicus]
MNSRMKVILKELMQSETYVTGKYLANINKVSTRTTRDDIRNLNIELADYGALVESIMSKGYKLVIKDEQLFRNFLTEMSEYLYMRDDVHPQTPKERVHFIMVRLLLEELYIKLEDLAEELFVSKSTVQNDLKDVKRILLAYDITLDSRPNHGLMIKGDEVKVRFCIAEIMFNRTQGDGFNYLDPLFSFLTKAELDTIQDIILTQIKAHSITLSDIAIQNLVVHIAIAYERIRSGNHVTLYRLDAQQIEEQTEYVVAHNIVDSIQKTFLITFPQEETAYIAIHLLGTKMLTFDAKGDRLEQVMEAEILETVTKMLERVESELSLGVKDDQELVMALCLHLKPAINRYKYGMNIRNPMLADIKRNYPLAFEAGILAGLVIEQHTETKINENEIGYLALHIGAAIERRKITSGPLRCLVVCASGLGTAQLIYYRLKNRFGESLDVVGTTEYYKLKKRSLEGIDFIISSIPIREEFPIPILEVNAVLSSNDMEKVDRFLAKEQNNTSRLFKRELMFLNMDFKSREETMTYISEQLMQRSLVEETFLSSIYKREEVAPTSYGNLVAIPHPITPQSSQTFLAVCTLQEPIEWKEKQVQFVCVLCVKKNSQEDLQFMYEALGEIVASRPLVEKLISAKNYDEFMNQLIREAEL